MTLENVLSNATNTRYKRGGAFSAEANRLREQGRVVGPKVPPDRIKTRSKFPIVRAGDGTKITPPVIGQPEAPPDIPQNPNNVTEQYRQYFPGAASIMMEPPNAGGAGTTGNSMFQKIWVYDGSIWTQYNMMQPLGMPTGGPGAPPQFSPTGVTSTQWPTSVPRPTYGGGTTFPHPVRPTPWPGPVPTGPLVPTSLPQQPVTPNTGQVIPPWVQQYGQPNNPWRDTPPEAMQVPYMQYLTGGGQLAPFSGPNLPVPSSYQWGQMAPYEQQAYRGTVEGTGMTWDDWYGRMQQMAPQWKTPSRAQYTFR